MFYHKKKGIPPATGWWSAFTVIGNNISLPKVLLPTLYKHRFKLIKELKFWKVLENKICFEVLIFTWNMPIDHGGAHENKFWVENQICLISWSTMPILKLYQLHYQEAINHPDKCFWDISYRSFSHLILPPISLPFKQADYMNSSRSKNNIHISRYSLLYVGIISDSFTAKEKRVIQFMT